MITTCIIWSVWAFFSIWICCFTRMIAPLTTSFYSICYTHEGSTFFVSLAFHFEWPCFGFSLHFISLTTTCITCFLVSNDHVLAFPCLLVILMSSLFFYCFWSISLSLCRQCTHQRGGYENMIEMCPWCSCDEWLWMRWLAFV